MAFGKKKSVSPLANVRTQKRTKPSERHVRSTPETPDLNAMTTITLTEAGRIAAGLCEARGYPPDSLGATALYVIWLESRRLPALSSMAKDILEHWGEDLRQRGPGTTAHGMPVFKCPLMASAFTGEIVEQLVEAGPGKKADFICHGPLFLFFPRLIDHASKYKIALNVEIHPTDRYTDNPTSFILYEDEFAVHQGTTHTSGPANVLIRILPQDMLPPRSAFSSEHPKRKSVDVQTVLLDLISDFRQGAGFSGPLPFENGFMSPETTPPPLGMRPFAPKTLDFFNQLIDSNSGLTTAFSALSKGDRSMLLVIVFGDSEGKDHSTTVLVTSPTSRNADFYRQCEQLGWMLTAPQDNLPDDNFLAYQVTKTGRMGLSVLLGR